MTEETATGCDPQVSLVNKDIFLKFNNYLENEQELREKIRETVRLIDQEAKQITLDLQIIHSSLTGVGEACMNARKKFAVCKEHYEKLKLLVPAYQYYRYFDHWNFVTQRLIFLIGLVIFLEKGFLVQRDTCAAILGLEADQNGGGFHLDVECYLMGILQLASELSRFATNSVTLGEYSRPFQISRFVGDLNSGFRLLNLKNDGLRKRFDSLKYDVKKIEEIVYDLSVRGLKPTPAE